MNVAAARFAKLTPRMRDCLRLVYDRKTSKEIATLLTSPEQRVAEATVHGYIAEAVRLLDAANRKDAAEQLRAFEGDTYKVTPQSLGGDPTTAIENEVGEQVPGSFRSLLPIRPKGAINNDLNVRHRLAWIAILAIGLAFGSGAVVNAVIGIDHIVQRG